MKHFVETIRNEFREIYGSLSVEELVLNRDLSATIQEIENFFENEGL